MTEPPRPRTRLWRFQRYKAPPPPDPMAGVDQDWFFGDHGDPEETEPLIPSPEDFLPSPPKPRGPLSHVPPVAAAKPALLCFMGFFIASAYYWQGGRDAGGWASGEAVLEHGEWWRLVTALFTHADLGHLLSNSPLFLIFGWQLHAFFGAAAFPLAAFAIGALSNLVTIALYAPEARLVGASGMLYGMISLWLVLYVRFEISYSVPMRIFRAIGVSLLLLFPTTFHKTTSYLAHASGFAIGLPVGVILIPFVRVRVPPPAVDGALRP